MNYMIYLLIIFSLLNVLFAVTFSNNKQDDILLNTDISSNIVDNGLTNEVMKIIDLENQFIDYEMDKQRYYEILRNKLGINKNMKSEHLNSLRRRDQSDTIEDVPNKRGYYTRPCLLNAISCYWYG
jgi:hypothetical protein